MLKACEKPAVMHSIVKHILLNNALSKIVSGNTLSYLTRPRPLEFTISVDFSTLKDLSALKIDI